MSSTSQTDADQSGTIIPRNLSIVWGDDPRYWTKNSDGTVQLNQVCWLEVTGSKKVKTGKKYKISFKVSLDRDAFGWNGCPVSVMAKIGKKGRYSWKRMKPLDQFYGCKETFTIPDEEFSMEVSPKNEEEELYFGLYEIWSGRWKGGLKIHEAKIEPVP